MTDLAVPVLEPTASYQLADRYRAGAGPVLLTGVQAIARMLVEQHRRDAREGRRVATFVSGYQGSPLAGVDRLLGGMPDVLAAHDITFVPGLNEELAATAVWGSQAVLPAGRSTHDGVIGVWYGKGPGLDRATDLLRHANHYGVNANGGMLLLVGDDPGSKSSSLPVVSERALAAMNIPVLYPRNAAEIVTLGMHGIALSRASGCVVALKIVADVADGSWLVPAEVGEVDPVVPQIEWSGKPFQYRQRPMAAPTDSVLAEADLHGPRRAMVEAYAAANRLDVIASGRGFARVGIVAAGSTFDAARQAMLDLGVDDQALERAGIRLLKLGMIHPVVPDTVRRFADGLTHILIAEEKTGFLESAVREALYGATQPPMIVGKRDTAGQLLVPSDGDLTAGRLRAPLHRFLREFVAVHRPPPPPLSITPVETRRAAYFCSGCPHNRSTVVPEGSLAGGGIGCHTMVTMSGRPDTAVTGLTPMGLEGAQWIGQSRFTDIDHIFQNLGDGTFFHSGQLAVQACVAARVNITYKLLFNEVVAMTGAQHAEGALTVAQLTRKLADEGVAQIIVCAEDPSRHRLAEMASGTRLWSRDRLDEAQRLLRDTPGVTVLIYDQHCAAESRRMRKRGLLPAKRSRVIINEAACEGCGDCGIKSNCLSVQPVSTPFGMKTRIDQTSCNVDYSCLDGECPSFVTVDMPDGTVPRPTMLQPPDLPDRGVPPLTGTWNVLLAGIGGTGIVTVNQVLATAAMLSGLQVSGLDQTGLSQKAGPVVSHLRFGAEDGPSNRISPAAADGILAFDLLTAVDRNNIGYGSADRTVAAVSTSESPTGAMIYDRSIEYPDTESMLSGLRARTQRTHSVDALAAAQTLLGDTTCANFLLVGLAWEAGVLPLPSGAIEEAITINGVAVQANIAAFRWGRTILAQPQAFTDATAIPTVPSTPDRAVAAMLDRAELNSDLREAVLPFVMQLVDFQNKALADRYLTVVSRVWAAERLINERQDLTMAVVRGAAKLLAYKDEYEVARLLTHPEFQAKVRAEFGGAAVTYRLHPPALRKLGLRKKIALRPGTHGLLRLLAKGKILRGTVFDPFGFVGMRRLERALREHYLGVIDTLLNTLTAESYDNAVAVADAAQLIRGYEHVKLAGVAAYRAKLADLGISVPLMPGEPHSLQAAPGD